jgi:hypothetical protein
MSLKIEKDSLCGVDKTFTPKGFNVVGTFKLKANNVWNGESFTVLFQDPDSHFHDKTFTVETVNGSTETITKTFPYSYSAKITIKGYSTNYLDEQITLGNLVNNVPNSTLEQYYTGDNFVQDDKTFGKFKITIKAKDGYKFVKDTLFNDINQSFDYNDNLTVARQIVGNVLDNLNLGWVFTGQTVEKETEIINNITGNCEETHTVDGTNVSITVTGNSDYAKFVGVSVEYTDINGETKTVVPDFSGNVINISLNDVKQGTTVTLSGAYRLVCTTVNNMTGCNVTGLKPYYIENETVNVIATANGKTHFDADNLPVANWEPLTGGAEQHPFVLSNNGKTATLTFTFPNDREKVSDSTFTLLGGTVPDTEVTGYGSINVYLVDTKTLDDFSKIRFTKKLNENYEYEYYDIGKYVNRLHKVYVDVPNVSPTSLKLANFDTSINTNSVDDSKVHVNFGNVLLPVNSNSSNDFNATIQCFIPFVGFVPVDSDFIGKELNLSYDIDLITGYCAYNLSCDGITINNGTANCSSEIIYKTLANDEISTIGDLSDTNTVLMGLEPYINIKYFEPLNVPVNNTTEQKRIGDVTGFSQFENVNLTTDSNMLVDEFNEIVSQLANGVYL